MVRILARLAMWVLAVAATLYLCDFAVWRVKMARGTGMGTVTVGLMQVASLKGNKEEYFPDGTEDVSCSRSLFPQAGAGACWWVEQHRTVFER